MATAKKVRKTDLFKEILPALDQRGSDIWDCFDKEQQAEIQKDFWVLNRWMSSVSPPRESWMKGRKPTREQSEYFVEAVNEFYNKNWFVIQKHPKLLWQLLCLCGYDSDMQFTHTYIPLKTVTNKKEQLLATWHPQMKWADIQALAAITTDKEIKEYAKDLGWDKKQIADIKL